MEAAIKTFNDEKWETTYTITTDPVSVTDSTGVPLAEDELALWLDSQPPVPYQGKRLTAKDNLEQWLQVVSTVRYSRMKIVLS